jgi:ribosomal protein S18 acetylase RimI-like enzyme
MSEKTQHTLRPLSKDDLDRVVAIDHALSGQSRRGFYERRLAAALKEPKGFIYVAACLDDRLVGFVFARILGGEFGAQKSVAVLDALGTDPEDRRKGAGQAMLEHLEQVMRDKGIAELQTQADWSNRSLLTFLDAAGFERAPRVVLERDVSAPMPS